MMVGNAIAFFLGMLLVLYGVVLVIDPNHMYAFIGRQANWERRFERLVKRHISVGVRRVVGLWLARIGGVLALLLGSYICVAATSELIA